MKHITTIIITLLTWISIVGAQAQIPDRPNPPRLVNDFANMLNAQEQRSLESKLVDFTRRTSTQIVLVIVKSLNGGEKSMFATEIGHEWGVGQKGLDNGIVILIKQKTGSEKGEVFISVGYGLEAVIPDATAKRIVENEIIPNFKQGGYYQGINAALNTMMQLSLGEFSAKEYNERVPESNAPGLIVVGIIFFLVFFGNFFGRAGRIRKGSVGRNLPFWVLLSMMGSGSHGRGGSYGNFSSGGGSFGGFGGGGFGGGGAGGSW